MGIVLAGTVAAKAASPWIAPAIAGGIGALGSIGASLIGRSSAKQQMRFQERMSNTAHQRQMKDLSKAGLNPLLTGKFGGSSTPQGTSFTPENPLANTSKNFMEAKLMNANIDNIKQSTFTNSALEDKYHNEGALANERFQTEEIDRALKMFSINSAKADSALWQAIGEAGKGGKALSPALQILLKYLLPTKAK